MIRSTAHRRRVWSDRTTGRLAWAAVVWTVLAGLGLLLAPGTPSSTSVSSSGPVASSGAVSSVPPSGESGETRPLTTTTSTQTLLDHEGVGVIPVLLVPVALALALAGSMGGGPAARRRRIAAGWVLVGACAVGIASLGAFFLPAAVALLAAGLKTRHPGAPHETAQGRRPRPAA